MAIPLPDVFRVNVRRRLFELGWGQRRLAAEMRVTDAAISIMLNSTKSPGLEFVDKVAKALQCNSLYLLTAVASEESEKIIA